MQLLGKTIVIPVAGTDLHLNSSSIVAMLSDRRHQRAFKAVLDYIEPDNERIEIQVSRTFQKRGTLVVAVTRDRAYWFDVALSRVSKSACARGVRGWTPKNSDMWRKLSPTLEPVGFVDFTGTDLAYMSPHPATVRITAENAATWQPGPLLVWLLDLPSSTGDACFSALAFFEFLFTQGDQLKQHCCKATGAHITRPQQLVEFARYISNSLHRPTSFCALGPRELAGLLHRVFNATMDRVVATMDAGDVAVLVADLGRAGMDRERLRSGIGGTRYQTPLPNLAFALIACGEPTVVERMQWGVVMGAAGRVAEYRRALSVAIDATALTVLPPPLRALVCDLLCTAPPPLAMSAVATLAPKSAAPNRGPDRPTDGRLDHGRPDMDSDPGAKEAADLIASTEGARQFVYSIVDTPRPPFVGAAVSSLPGPDGTWRIVMVIDPPGSMSAPGFGAKQSYDAMGPCDFKGAACRVAKLIETLGEDAVVDAAAQCCAWDAKLERESLACTCHLLAATLACGVSPCHPRLQRLSWSKIKTAFECARLHRPI